MHILIYGSTLLIIGIIIACTKAYYDKKTEERCRSFQSQAKAQMESCMKNMQRPINISSSVHNESYIWKEGRYYVVKCAKCGYEQPLGENASDVRKHLGYIGWIMNNRRPYCKYCKATLFPERYGESAEKEDKPQIPEQPMPTIPDETSKQPSDNKVIDEFK